MRSAQNHPTLPARPQLPDKDAPRWTPIGSPPDQPEDAGVLKFLYTPVEAAEALSIGRSTLYELLARGELRSVRIGSCRRVPVAAVAAYVDRLVADESQGPGTVTAYRSSGVARDAAVDMSTTDEKVTMAQLATRHPQRVRP